MFAKLKKKIEDESSRPVQNKSLQTSAVNSNHNNSSSVLQAPIHNTTNSNAYQKRLSSRKSPRTSTSDDLLEDRSTIKSATTTSEDLQTKIARRRVQDSECESPDSNICSESHSPDVKLKPGIVADENMKDEADAGIFEHNESMNISEKDTGGDDTEELRRETERRAMRREALQVGERTEQQMNELHTNTTLEQVTSDHTPDDWLEKQIENEKLISSLERDLISTKKKLLESENEKKSLTKRLEATRFELSEANEQVTLLKGELEVMTFDTKNLKDELKAFGRDLKSSSQERDDLSSKVEKLTQNKEELDEKMEMLRREKGHLDEKHLVVIAELQTQVEVAEEDRRSLEVKILELEENFKNNLKLVEVEATRTMRQSLLEAEEQIKEKNRMLKKQEQKLADLRKLVQRELSGKTATTTSNSVNSNNNSNSALAFDTNYSMAEAEEGYFNNSSDVESIGEGVARLNITSNEMSGVRFGSRMGLDLTQDMNFKYLKHVILKFFLSREHEALQLIKVVSMLLKFNDDEEKMIRDTLHWRTSWFRSKPHLPEKGQSAIALPALY